MSKVEATHTVLDITGQGTGTGKSGAYDCDGSEVILCVEASNASGTPTLDFEVEYSVDGTNYFSAATPQLFTQITANGFQAQRFALQGRYFRLDWTVGGTTPSFDFKMVAMVH